MPKLKQTDKSTYEAAMDLGAAPVYAFFKVVFPDILPGVLSGFLLAFTMSLDDFIITHFTRGAGINTLSTLIYSEVRRGIEAIHGRAVHYHLLNGADSLTDYQFCTETEETLRSF